MELIAPAGNLEKVRAAYCYGADAVYIGIKNFSLRTRADNFSESEQDELIRLKSGKKLYCALNVYFHNNDLTALERDIDYIARYPFDAFIISDPGVIRILRKYRPDVELHLSTQANCTNSEAARFYRDLGFTRVIPGRELSLSEIESIKNAVPGLELEVFVHGAMCLAYSGRCFLSSWMAGRSANSGDCSHSCRWKYRVLEEQERPGEYFPVIEGENHTTILSSKDLCMIDHLRELRDAGVDALKLEGRMKSVYYTAIVTRAYRKMLESLNGKAVPDLKGFRDELEKVSHRQYSTGFYFGKNDIEKPTFTGYEKEYDFMGIVTEKYGNGRYRIDVKNSIHIYDTLEYTGPDVVCIEDRGFSLLDKDDGRMERADHDKFCVLLTDKNLEEGFIIRRRSI